MKKSTFRTYIAGFSRDGALNLIYRAAGMIVKNGFSRGLYDAMFTIANEWNATHENEPEIFVGEGIDNEFYIEDDFFYI